MPEKQSVCLHTEKPVKINKWKVAPGTIVYEGRVVLIYEENSSGKSVKLKSRHVGTVSKISVKEGDVVNPGEVLFEIDIGCSHPTVINDLCAECGADLQKDGQVESKATIPMVHSIPQLKVSHEQAQQLGRADTERLLKERKLVLLVDLDQTLIHTTHDNIPNNLKDVHHFQLFGCGNPWYHTRLRPGTLHFLLEMDKLFELHICTFGVRPYAHMVAHILDKDAKLFSNRILSRDECFDFNSKHANLQALFPCGDELVCIIDDREDVWDYSPNLIPVKPYHFFKNTGDINDPNLPPVCKTSNYLAKGVKVKEPVAKKKEGEKEETPEEDVIDVEDEDDYLHYLEDILKSVHTKFYKIYDKAEAGEADVKWVIKSLREKVLAGCCVVLSGVVPLKEEVERSEAWRLALSLGATVSRELVEGTTTHLIAGADATAKVHRAKRMTGVHIVSPAWLITCAHRWEKVDERLFQVGSQDWGGLSQQRRVERARQEPPRITLSLSEEEMAAMTEEVDQEEDTDSNQESSSEGNSSGGEGDDWSQMAHMIEQGLDDEGPQSLEPP